MDSLKKHLRHFFIPHVGNNFRSRALHLDVLTAYVLVALLVLTINSTLGKHVLGVAVDISTGRLMELTNQQRQNNGLAPLSYNNTLAAAAQLKAQDMFAKNYWAHNSPDGTTPWTFFRQAGYSYQYAGENLARDFEYSQGVIDGWMNSPTHKANILRAEYKDVGFAVVNGQLDGQDTTLVVQLFGTPYSSPPPAQAGAKSALVAQAKEPEVTKKTVIPTATIIPTEIPTGVPITGILPADESMGSIVSASQIVNPPPKSFLARLWQRLSTMDLTFITILTIATALLFDLYYAYKLNMLRLSGKNIAHLVFLISALIGFLLVAKGAIV